MCIHTMCVRVTFVYINKGLCVHVHVHMSVDGCIGERCGFRETDW